MQRTFKANSPVFIGARREHLKELDKLGVSSLKVNRLNCVGEGVALANYALTAREEYDAYLAYIPQYCEDGMPVPTLMLAGLFSAVRGRLFVSAERHPEDRDCGKRVT